MGSVTDEWAARSAERGMRPLALAFTLSLVCHVLVLSSLRNFRLESRSSPPLVVTMIGHGDDGGGAAPPAPVEAARAPAAAVAVPVAPVPAVVPRPAAVPPPLRARERAIRRRAVASALPVAAAPAPVAAPADVASESNGTGGSVGAVASAAGGNAGIGTGAGPGRGTGTGGAGPGGSDGLRAFCASCPAPEYPGRARRQGWQGTVDVELAIASDGRVREARVERSSGYPSLDDVAVDVARRSRFTVPDGGDGLRGQLRYRFVLDATAASR